MLNPRYDIFGTKDLAGAKFEGQYEFPATPGIEIEETKEVRGIPFDRIATELDRSGAFLHFYNHDRRFVRRFMEQKEKWLDEFRCFAGIIGMDNSVSRDLPLAEQMHSYYLNRAMDYWLCRQEFRVIPNVSWGDWRSFEFCFDGIAKDSTIAISSHGSMRESVEQGYFYDGLVLVPRVLHPRKVIFHGRISDMAREILTDVGIEIVHMPSRMAEVHPPKGDANGHA